MKVFTQFKKNKKGVAAVEFALVAPVFFACIFCIFETSVDYYIMATLDNVVEQVSVPIQSGVVQQANMDVATFKSTYICPKLNSIFSCADIVVNVESFPNSSRQVWSWHISPPTIPIVQQALAKFCPGSGGYNTTVTISYPVPIIAAIWTTAGTTTLNGKTIRAFQASTGFVVSPTFTVTPAC